MSYTYFFELVDSNLNSNNILITDLSVKRIEYKIFRYDDENYRVKLNQFKADPNNENKEFDIKTISETVELPLLEIKLYWEIGIGLPVIRNHSFSNVDYKYSFDINYTNNLYRLKADLKYKRLENDENFIIQFNFNKDNKPLEFKDLLTSVEHRLDTNIVEIPYQFKDDKTLLSFGTSFDILVDNYNTGFNVEIDKDQNKIKIINTNFMLGEYNFQIKLASQYYVDYHSIKIVFKEILSRIVYEQKFKKVELVNNISDGKLIEIIIEDIDNSKDNLIMLKI